MPGVSHPAGGPASVSESLRAAATPVELGVRHGDRAQADGLETKKLLKIAAFASMT